MSAVVPGGKVCQACGDVGYFESIDEHTAGHCEAGGDFLAFSAGHPNCAQVPFSSALRTRLWRYCEICRGPVDALADTRRALAWVCGECEVRAVADEPLGDVLAELASRRYEARRAGPVATADLEFEITTTEPNPRIPALRGWLPSGLALCSSCGTVRGETWRPAGGTIEPARSACLCEGCVCERCRRRRLRRPSSDFFDAEDGHWWHVPWFSGYRRTCSDCADVAEARHR